MYPIGVVGPGSDRLAKRLAEHLAEHGSVGVIANGRAEAGRENDEPARKGSSIDGGTALTRTRTGALDRYRSAGAKRVYGLDERGWSGVGEDSDLRGALYAMAPACEFCIVDGATESADIALPWVVLGDADPTEAESGTILASASDAETVEPDELRESLLETEPIETLESLVEKVKRSPRAPQSGAIATFTGRVRAREDADDATTEFLEFEKYADVAEERMERISTELEEREGIKEVRMHHRSGRIEYGEDIVFVVVLAGHRGEAFETVEDGIDRLKAEVPIFKKEATIDEEFWVHDRP